MVDTNLLLVIVLMLGIRGRIDMTIHMFSKRCFIPVQIYEPIMTCCFLGTDVQANNPMGPFKLLKGKNLMISFFNECF